jgi:hypothetical protein
MHLKKEICKKPSLIFFGKRGSWRPCGHWEFIFESLNLHIWRRKDWPLMFSFLSLISIKDGNVLQEKDLEYVLPFFFNRRKCGRGWGQTADGSISLTNSSTPIFGVIMIGFGHFFFHG